MTASDALQAAIAFCALFERESPEEEEKRERERSERREYDGKRRRRARNDKKRIK